MRLTYHRPLKGEQSGATAWTLVLLGMLAVLCLWLPAAMAVTAEAACTMNTSTRPDPRLSRRIDHLYASTAFSATLSQSASSALKQMMTSSGWPSRSMVGASVVDKLGTLLRKDVNDEKLQDACYRSFVDSNEINSLAAAHLRDVMLLEHGKSQTAGTVFEYKDGALVLKGKAHPTWYLNRTRDDFGLPLLDISMAAIMKKIKQGEPFSEAYAIPPLSMVAPVRKNPKLRKKLIEMNKSGQAALEKVVATKNYSSSSPAAKADESIQKKHQQFVMNLIRAHGMPTVADVGRQGTDSLFAIIQHFPSAEDQRECLPLVRGLLAQHGVLRDQYAELYDRVMVRLGKPQKYGTQFRTVKHNGKLYMQLDKVSDIQHLNVRRATMTLPPEQVSFKKMKKEYGLPILALPQHKHPTK